MDPLIHAVVVSGTLFVLAVMFWCLCYGGGFNKGRFTIQWLLGLTLFVAILVRLGIYWINSSLPKP
jgi:hypothetical protein